MQLAGPLAAAFAHRAALDVMLGLTGAAAFPHMTPTTLNVLQAVASHPQCGVYTKSAGILFVISSLASNIVDYSMVAVRSLPRPLPRQPGGPRRRSHPPSGHL